tara:strand:+ start:381 stop:683 length:303 start_codon:yes stop_codon:yes gene_type:complete
MKRLFLLTIIFSLIIVITLTKNSAKKLESEIFLTKENIRILKNQYDLVLLDFNYLSSPKKLMEYQNKYFEKELKSIDINKIKILKIKNGKLTITDFINEK